MVLDLGRSNYLTSESGSANVRDIILEKMPKTILLFTTSTLIITVIGLYLGAFAANRAGSFWDKINSASAVFSSSFPTWWVGMLMIFAFAFTYHIFPARATPLTARSEEHTSELQSRQYLVCRLLLEKKKKTNLLTTI